MTKTFPDSSLPSILAPHPWISEGAFALFSQLCEFRNVVIHRGTFERHLGSDGGIVIKDKESKPPKSIHLTQIELEHLGLFATVLLRCCANDWALDEYQQKRLRYSLSQLSKITKLPTIPAAPPRFVTAVVALESYDAIIDFASIAEHFRKLSVVPNSHCDPVVDMTAVVSLADGKQELRYFSSESLPKEGFLTVQQALAHTTPGHLSEKFAEEIRSWPPQVTTPVAQGVKPEVTG